MIERVAYQDIMELLLCAAGLVAFLIFMVWITTPPPVIIPEGSYLNTAGVVVPIPNGMMLINGTLIQKPTLIPVPTPRPTPQALPTIAQKPVDPFIHGERFEGQWFKWHREKVSGTQDLDAGIIVYRHAWLDNYTWYNSFMGNYQKQEPTKGNRYFVVWLHQEVFGTDAHNNTGMYPFADSMFRLQAENKLIEVDTVHNPINRILELENKWDYYNVLIAQPFGWDIIRSGMIKGEGPYTAVRKGEIRLGKYNSVDGYMLFEVPKKTMTEDVVLLGNFAGLGSVYWSFDD